MSGVSPEGVGAWNPEKLILLKNWYYAFKLEALFGYIKSCRITLSSRVNSNDVDHGYYFRTSFLGHKWKGT